MSLSVVECDADGLIVAMVTFDIDDLDGAYDALDARYVELGGPDLRPYRHAFNSRDWDRFAAFFEADASFENRRPAGYGRLDRDGFIAYERAILEVAPDVTLRIDHVDAVTPAASLIVGRDVGTRDGGPFEVTSVTLARTGPTGRISTLTIYDIDDLDTARADFARLTAPSLDDHFPNHAWRAMRRSNAAANARDWDAFTATLAPSVAYHDRRTGLAVELIGDDARSSWRTVFDVDECRLDSTLVATRGERLALVLAVAVLRDGEAGWSEAAGLAVVETDAGLITHYTARDPDDMTGALDELDARYAALGGSPLMATARHSFDARDWDTFASVFTEDCTIIDSRTAGWGSVDRDVFVDYQRSVVDVADDAHLWTDHVRERGTVSISTGRAFGTRAGGNWEIAFVTVGVTETDGRTRRFETYELGDMAVAIARFHELVGAEDEPVANAAWRAAEAQAHAVNTQNWAALTETLAPHFEHDERRTGVGLVTRDDEAIAIYRYLFTLDQCRQKRRLLATRGDRLALVHSTVTFEDGVAGPAEVVSLHVCEVDDRGLVTHAITFDANEREKAEAEMRARAAALDAQTASTRDPLVIPRNLAVRTVEQPGWTLLAALVDDLCLHATPDGLVLHQVDASGTVIAQMEFGAGERRAASEELARRYFERHGIIGGAARLSKAMNARDLGAVRDCMADSCVIEDHRHLRVADLQDVDSHIAVLAPTFTLVRDYLVELLRVDAVEPLGSVGLSGSTGTTADGGPVETLVVALTMWDDDGLITRIEIYEPEDAATAIARLRALAP